MKKTINDIKLNDKFMKTMLNVLLLMMIASGIILLEACGDDDKPKTELEKLPAATQEGKGTFGCLVNGKAWVIKTSVDASAFYQEGVLSITAYLTNTTWDHALRLGMRDDNLSTGTYSLTNYPDRYGALQDLGDLCITSTSDEYQGSITFTKIDQINFIISGTFEFAAYSDDCSIPLVQVTHGRFDLHYAP